MDTISGIPSHPLFVHIPAVLLPLAAVGVILMVVKPAWKERYQWATLVVGFLGMLGAILAAGSGESLEEISEREMEGMSGPQPWESHAEAGELARTVSILFFLLLAAYVLVPWFLRRRAAAAASGAPAEAGSPAPAAAGPPWLAPVLAGLCVLGAAASTYTVIDAGHSGAKAVWEVEGDDGD